MLEFLCSYRVQIYQIELQVLYVYFQDLSAENQIQRPAKTLSFIVIKINCQLLNFKKKIQ